MSEARALTNIIGNGVATIVISKSENEFHPQVEAEEKQNIIATEKKLAKQEFVY